MPRICRNRIELALILSQQIILHRDFVVVEISGALSLAYIRVSKINTYSQNTKAVFPDSHGNNIEQKANKLAMCAHQIMMGLEICWLNPIDILTIQPH